METEWDDRKGRPYAGTPSLAKVVVEEKNLRFPVDFLLSLRYNK